MVKITCTNEERDKLLYRLGHTLTCNQDCATRLIYGCYGCIARCKNSIEWDITDLDGDSVVALNKELSNVFHKYGYYIDSLTGQFADEGEWRLTVKKGTEPNGKN